FARLLMHDADVLLLDEPFASVDRATTDDLLGLLADWHARGRTIIVVLHDLEAARQHFPEALLLAGQVVAWGPVEQVLTPDNLHLARPLCAGDYLCWGTLSGCFCRSSSMGLCGARWPARWRWRWQRARWACCWCCAA